MSDLLKIKNDIKQKNFKPIYFLYGSENYFIDEISDLLESTVLNEDEKSFNLSILYGKETNFEQITSEARQFPMMSAYRLIIIKEAQSITKNYDDFEIYLNNIQPTSIIVFLYKKETSLDKRKKVMKLIAEKGVVYESKKLYENQLASWITSYLANYNYIIDPKASVLLGEYLGTDLSKLVNELNKLKLIFPENYKITDKDIEENIGINRNFNNFELRKALGERNALKVFKIIDYFGANSKQNSIVPIISTLYNFFTSLYIIHVNPDKSKGGIAKAIGINPYFADEYLLAIRNYNMKKISKSIEAIKEADLKSKGIGVTGAVTEFDLLKELMFKILN